MMDGRTALALALALWLALRGLRKRALSPSGAAAAFIVGALHLACGVPFGATLIAFYLTSSKLTKWRGDLKAQLEEGHVAGGQRSASQVLANSALGAALAAAAAWLHGGGAGDTAAAAALLPLVPPAFVGFYACCCGDTWSSELGIAAAAPPRLLTTLRRVPPGTNGGVSTLGLGAAAAGGALVGLVYCGAAALQQAALVGRARGDASSGADWRLLPLAVCAGLAGSLLDSLLGATLQWSGHDAHSGRAVSGRPPAGSAHAADVKHVAGRDLLTNTQVNMISSTLTSLLAAAAWHCWLVSDV